jgi:hypothetical protein
MIKITAVVGISVLGLVLGTSAPARAQHGNGHDNDQGHSSKEQHSDQHQGKGGDQHHESHQDQHHESHAEPRHDQAQHSDHGRPEHAQSYHPQPSHSEHTPRPVRHEEQQYRQHDVWQGHRAKDWKHEHHSWHERGGYHGYRIPDDRFRAHFGRAHWFRVRSAPILVVDGSPRFQYGGFWFSMVDPWPEYWAPTWYETDDVYVDYVNDGYYMYNRRHPGVGIAINVSF